MQCGRQKVGQAGGVGGFGSDCPKAGTRAKAGSEASSDREGLILHGDRDHRGKDYRSEVRALTLLIAIVAIAALFLKVGTDKTTAHGRLRHQRRRTLVLSEPRQ